MKIGIVGGGTVGRATARAFVEHVDEVRVYDVLRERGTHKLEQVLGCDLIFVCLPTPTLSHSAGCDLSTIDCFFNQQAVLRASANYVLRSTVPIGTTRRLASWFPNLVHSPEFLTARCSITDAHLPARNVIGIPGSTLGAKWNICSDEGSEPLIRAGAEPLQSLLLSRFPGVPCYVTTSDESEAVKLFQNGFFAVKVAYWNEVRCLADKLELNWDSVLEAVLADGRIAHSHTKVPGPDGKRGYGGACLPKDLSNLIACIKDAGLVPWITSAAKERNLGDRENKE